MSEPTYRIETEYDASFEFAAWFTKVYRLSDGQKVYDSQAETEDAAIDAAKRWIKRVSDEQPTGRIVFATEDGEIVPAPEPQSLRA